MQKICQICLQVVQFESHMSEYYFSVVLFYVYQCKKKNCSLKYIGIVTLLWIIVIFKFLYFKLRYLMPLPFMSVELWFSTVH